MALNQYQAEGEERGELPLWFSSLPPLLNYNRMEITMTPEDIVKILRNFIDDDLVLKGEEEENETGSDIYWAGRIAAWRTAVDLVRMINKLK